MSDKVRCDFCHNSDYYERVSVCVACNRTSCTFCWHFNGRMTEEDVYTCALCLDKEKTKNK